MSKRLLFITCHKLDENIGGSNASKGFIRCFAELFDDCSIIYPEIKCTTPYIPSIYKLIPCHDSRTKLQKGIDMYRGVVGALFKCVKNHLKNYRYDLIVIDHSVTATSLIRTIKATNAKIITIHHNVECDYLRDNGKERPITYRIPYNYFAKKAERDCLQNSAVNLTVTEHDANTFRSWYPDVHIHNWGIFEYRNIPDKTFAQRPRGLTFVITGSLSFVQSLTPIMDFIHRYWPIILQHYPHAKLLIAGRNPAKELVNECTKQASITIVPNPEDMAAVVRQADYYICPISAGSGMKLRIYDGLKEGLPILCHEVSVSGYEYIAKAGCLFAYHDESSFSASLNDTLHCTLSRQQVYDSFCKEFSLQTGISRLHNILQQENII